jgi:hypothetical protein
MIRRLRILVPMVLGALVGTAAVLGYGALRERKELAGTERAARTQAARPPGAPASRGNAPPPAFVRQGTETSPNRGPELATLPSKEDVLREHEEDVRRHQQEPIDVRWSTSAVKSLEKNLTQMKGRASFELVSVSCRTSSCLVSVRWKDYATAKRDYTALLHEPYEVNCARKIILPEPPREDSPYSATLIMQCSPEERRSGQSGPSTSNDG